MSKKVINRPKDSSTFPLTAVLVGELFVIYFPVLRSTPSELHSMVLLTSIFTVFIQALIIYKVSEGVNWARLLAVVGNSFLFLTIILLALFNGLDIFFSSDSFLNSLGIDTYVISEHKIFASFWLILLVASILIYGFNSDELKWFRYIKKQTSLKDRTKKFLKGMSIYLFIYFTLEVALEIKTLDYIATYGSSSLSPFQLPVSPVIIDGNPKTNAAFLAVLGFLIVMTLSWLYYFVVFVVFQSISGKTLLNDSDVKTDSSYYYAYKEIESNKHKKGTLWAKAFALSDGDPEKQKAIYVKLRAKEIDEENQ